MPVITNEAMIAIRAKAIGEFNSAGTKNVDGTWTIPLEDETIERLTKTSFPGESLSDTIIRLCSSRNN